MVDQLLQEVDADLRAERAQQFWRRNRSLIYSAVALILLATAGQVLWEKHREKKGGELFFLMTDGQNLFAQGKFAEAASAFEKAAAESSGEARTLAQLWEGRALQRDGKKDAAIAVLKTAGSERTLWGDLACLRLAGIDIAAAACLSDTHDSPLAGKRKEWSAANAWSNGNVDEAITIFEELATSSDTSEVTRAEISGWIATLRANQAPAKPVEDKPATVEKPAAETKGEEAPAE